MTKLRSKRIDLLEAFLPKWALNPPFIMGKSSLKWSDFSKNHFKSSISPKWCWRSSWPISMPPSHSGQVMYYDPPFNQPFGTIQKFFNRNDPYKILKWNCNFIIVVLRAGCAQFMTFWAENSTQYVKFDFKGVFEVQFVFKMIFSSTFLLTQ